MNPFVFQGYDKLVKEIHERVWSERIEEFKARPKSKYSHAYFNVYLLLRSTSHFMIFLGLINKFLLKFQPDFQNGLESDRVRRRTTHLPQMMKKKRILPPVPLPLT